MEWIYIKLDIMKNQKVRVSGSWLPKQMDVISGRDGASSSSLQVEHGPFNEGHRW